MVTIAPCGTKTCKYQSNVGTKMITIIALALAVSGGLYVGTIAFSAYQFAELDKAVALLQKADFINLA